MSEQSSVAGASTPRRVGVGPGGAGGRRSGSRGRDPSPRRQEDWSGFAKGLLTGVFVTVALGFVALGAWFRSEDGSPHRTLLPESLGGISASIAGPQAESTGESTAANPTSTSAQATTPAAESTPAAPPVAPAQAAVGSGQPKPAPDELEAMGIDDLMKVQERNRRVVGQAGGLLKAIGGSSR